MRFTLTPTIEENPPNGETGRWVKIGTATYRRATAAEVEWWAELCRLKRREKKIAEEVEALVPFGGDEREASSLTFAIVDDHNAALARLRHNLKEG